MTDQELKDLVASLTLSQIKTDEQIKETSKEIRELKESQLKTDEQIKKTSKEIRELKETQLKTDEQIKETDKMIKEISKEINESRIMQKEDHNTLYWMWLTQWDISEDIFSENIEDILMNIWKEIKTIDKQVKVPWKVELDLVCVNWIEVFVVEVKTKLTLKHVDKFLETSLPRFRKYYPKYKSYKLYWMVAWRTISGDVEEYANKKWLYVIKEMHNWNAKMLNNKDFKAKEYIF